MSELLYVYSNGRCGTQFLARQLGMVANGERIIHEQLPMELASREVFRNPEALYSRIGRTPELQGLFVHLANQLRNGVRNVNCGWPAFAWLDYLAERYGDRFRFVHLVRNPYDNAASHATHQTMLPQSLNPMEKRCKLFGTDPHVKFRQFADRYDRFGTFERHLFHWLEVTTYAQEHIETPGFQGLFRFEDIVAPDMADLNRLMSLLLGRDVVSPGVEPFDRVHRQSPWPLDFHIDPDLQQAVDALAIQLGYTPDALRQSRNPDRLRDTYSRKRFDLPCDPRIPVIAPK